MAVKILFDMERFAWGRKESLSMNNFVVRNVHIEPGKRLPFLHNPDRETVFVLLNGEGFIYLSRDTYKEGTSYGIKEGVVYKPVQNQIMYAKKDQVFSLITKQGSKKGAHFLVIHDKEGMEDIVI
jgi:mannose-6-phosphate isomerase-like protein (cupin superfamily)